MWHAELPGKRLKKNRKDHSCACTGTQISVMEQQNIEEELKDQLQDVLSRLQSKNFFQSDWDIASFAIFFIFIGMVLFFIVLVLIRCCCCCCCESEKPRRMKVGIENLAMEP
ncbi:hypothetical protein SKAU_G00047310 [Synaphobranchus kaupii]|uniref:Small integral membrane protein 22 n=1 Tax=Synaphobranchus kaupii TaxID=118154 RepID=A0A9Q1G355_SYNKA|nr:hypothetical protein SKAU_G00047310 [Synaphobranchus kaupii]